MIVWFDRNSRYFYSQLGQDEQLSYFKLFFLQEAESASISKYSPHIFSILSLLLWHLYGPLKHMP